MASITNSSNAAKDELDNYYLASSRAKAKVLTGKGNWKTWKHNTTLYLQSKGWYNLAISKRLCPRVGDLVYESDSDYGLYPIEEIVASKYEIPRALAHRTPSSSTTGIGPTDPVNPINIPLPTQDEDADMHAEIYATKETRAQWFKDYSELGVDLQDRLSEDIKNSLNEYLNDGIGLWAEIHRKFEQISTAEIQYALTQFHRVSMANCAFDFEKYTQAFQRLRDSLYFLFRSAHIHVNLQLDCFYYLQGLKKDNRFVAWVDIREGQKTSLLQDTTLEEIISEARSKNFSLQAGKDDHKDMWKSSQHPMGYTPPTTGSSKTVPGVFTPARAMRAERSPKGSKRPDYARKTGKSSDNVNHCGIDGHSGHKMDDCWTLHPEKRPSNMGNKNSSSRNNTTLNTADREFRAGMAVSNTIISPLMLRASSHTAGESQLGTYLDGGCNAHAFSDPRFFESWTENVDEIVGVGDIMVRATHIGTVKLPCYQPDGSIMNLILENVRYLPKGGSNLVSYSRLNETKLWHCAERKILFHRPKFTGKLTVIAYLDPVNGLFQFRVQERAYKAPETIPLLQPFKLVVNKATLPPSVEAMLWHQRLGHVKEATLTGTQKATTGLEEVKFDVDYSGCEACQLTDASTKHGGAQILTTVPGERLHMDLVGPIRWPSPLGNDTPTTSWQGYQYALHITDEATRYRWTSHASQKAALSWYENITSLVNRIDRANKSPTVKAIRCDQGGEFMNSYLLSWMKSKGIEIETSAAEAHWQNGMAEATNKILWQRTRAMMLHSGIPRTMWPEANAYATYITNRLCTKGDSPLHQFFSAVMQDPDKLSKLKDLSHIRTFGALCYVRRNTAALMHRASKVDARAERGYFMGFEEPETTNMLVWIPKHTTDNGQVVSKIIRTPNVTVVEKTTFRDTEMRLTQDIQILHDLEQTERTDDDLVTNLPIQSPGSTPLGNPEAQIHPQYHLPDIGQPSDRGVDVREQEEPQLGVIEPGVVEEDAGQAPQSPLAPPYSPITVDGESEEHRSKSGNIEPMDLTDVIPALNPPYVDDDNAVEVYEQESSICEPEDQLMRDVNLELAVDIADADEDEDITDANEEINEDEYRGKNSLRRSARLDNKHVDTYQNKRRRLYQSIILAAKTASSRRQIIIPTNYKDAQKQTEWKHWEAAMKTEIDNLVSQKTYSLVSKRPLGRVIIKGRWVYTVKYKPDHSIDRYKARWVVKGFMQRAGVDFHETYAPTLRGYTVRLLYALSALHGWQIHQADVTAAFLHSLLQEDIYMAAPEGFYAGGQVVKLHKSLYGLKQAPHLWFNSLAAALRHHGFTPLQYDECCFTNTARDAFVIFFVDDIQCLGPNSTASEALLTSLGTTFSMKSMAASTYLGMQIERDIAGKVLRVHQQPYTETVLEDLSMQDSHPVRTPLPESVNLTPNDGDCTAEERTYYQTVVGRVNYLVQWSRPDIAFAVSLLSRFLQNPSSDHQKALKHLLRYLNGTRSYGISYYYNTSDPLCVGYSDASHNSDHSTSKGYGGYAFFIAGGLTSWRSKLQPINALSSTEDEYIALTEACKEAMLYQNLLEELHIPQVPASSYYPFLIMEDSQPCLHLTEQTRVSARTKHIRIRYHFCRELRTRGDVKFEWIGTKKQRADGFTKSLRPSLHQDFVSMLQMSTSLRLRIQPSSNTAARPSAMFYINSPTGVEAVTSEGW